MTLLVNSEVVRLETDAAGRVVTGVVVSRDGGEAEETFRGSVVVLAAGAANSAKILLNSASDAHPAGLALGKKPNDTVFQKTLALNDYYLAGPDNEWPLGNIQMLGKSNAEAMKGEEPHLTKLAPHWSLDEVARHAVDFWLTTEDLPKPDNRVTVDRDATCTSATPRPTTPRRTGCTASSGRCSTTSAWPTITCCARTST